MVGSARAGKAAKISIVRSEDCKNSPKNGFAEEFAVQLLTGEKERLADLLSDDAELEIAGRKSVSGKNDVLAAAEKGLLGEIAALEIEFVLTHGRSGAANGRARVGRGWTSFCVILRFENVKASRVRLVRFYA